MTLATKYSTRNMVFDLIGQFANVTNILVLFMAMRTWKLCTYGVHAALPGYHPDGTIEGVLNAFFNQSIWPLLVWVPVAMIADAFIRQSITK